MSASLKILYSGDGLFEDDIHQIRGESTVQITTIPGLGTLPPPETFAEATKHCDLAIFKVNGGFEFIRYMQKFGSVPFIRSLFHSPKIKKVLWSVDTHVMKDVEARLSQFEYFEKIYSAHSAFMGEFDSAKSGWLPCCYRLSSRNDLRTFNQRDYPIERDVLFYYNPTPIGDRNQVALQAKGICDRMGLRSLFGHVGNWGVFPQFIKSSKVNLNLSMQGELNYRFFELQAFNAIQVTDRTSDHAKIGITGDGIYFIERDLSNLEEVLKQALASQTPTHSQDAILQSHMMIHRVLTIMQDVLGTPFHLA